VINLLFSEDNGVRLPGVF